MHSSLGIVASSHPRGAGAWTPLDVPGLKAWWDASDATTITDVAGAVSDWSDKSGNGYTLTQGTAAARPTTGTETINSLNVLRFDGGDVLAYAGTTGMNVETSTVFLVMESIAAVANAGLITAHDSSGNDFNSANAWLCETHTGAGHRFAAVRSLSGSDGRVSFSNTPTKDIYAARFSTAGVVDAWTAGGSSGTSTRNTTFGTAAGGFLVGGRYISGAISGSNRFNGRIAEIIVSSQSLTVANLNTVGNHLGNKWGITWSTIT